MRNMKRRILMTTVAATLVGNIALATPTWARSCSNEYVFAATRGVSDMDVTPALKVPLFPVTIVLDTVFLPFAVIAGCVG